MNTVSIPKVSLTSVTLPSVMLQGQSKEEDTGIIPGKTIIVKSKSDTISLKINNVIRTYSITPNKYSNIIVDEPVEKLTAMSNYEWNDDLYFIDFSHLDLSKLININDAFYRVRGVNTINIPNIIKNVTGIISGIFVACNKAETINISNFYLDDVTMFKDVFNGCVKLKDLRFGKNLKVDASFTESPLTHESALSVIDGLAEVTTQKTITFKDVTYDTLTEEDIAIATNKGWTVKRYPAVLSENSITDNVMFSSSELHDTYGVGDTSVQGGGV